jgi:hypothetical protein
MTMRATTTAHLPDRQTIEQGEIYADDHPFVEKYPQFFESTDDAAHQRSTRVEDTTARPGAKRGTPPNEKAPAKKAPAKKA